MKNEKAIAILEEIKEEGWLISETNKCIAIEALDMAISALSSGEYIKKSELLQHVVTEELSDYQDCDVIHAEEIDELTTYSFPDSSENKGEWIHILDSYYEDGRERESHWECSKCGSSKSGWGEFKFCPDCGADMREPKGEKGTNGA